MAFFLKIDFKKAYDNVNWKFVVNVLRQMGFQDKWCSWIFGVLSSAQASVLVNGSPTFEFKSDKGMRQGDPISPFLFMIVMEALSYLLDKACEVQILKGVHLPEDGPLVPHLFYVDDAFIVGDWCKENMLNMVRILRCFYACSGLKINLGKSDIYGIGIDSSEVDDISVEVGCKSDSLSFKYLGLSVGANMNRNVNWRPVYEIFEKRLLLWKSAMLSIGGRVTLTRSVLESLPCYYFSLYRALAKLEVVKTCAVKDLLAGEGLWLWRSDLISAIEVAEWVELQNSLSEVELSNRRDGWIWLGYRSREFSVRSVKNIISGNLINSNRYVFEWSKWVPSKCNVFAWMMEMNRIPTSDALSRRGIKCGFEIMSVVQ
ncbi:putative RNA-directed DNA polymerase [Helianthus debilis subsp. tardiflorus]